MELKKHWFAKPLKPYLKFMACFKLTREIIGVKTITSENLLIALLQPPDNPHEEVERKSFTKTFAVSNETKQRAINVFTDLYFNKEDDVIDWMNKNITKEYFRLNNVQKMSEKESKGLISDVINLLGSGLGINLMGDE